MTHQFPRMSRVATAIGLVCLGTALQAQAKGERPEFAALVASGDLPPVAERVSDEPQVVDFGDVGTYGGKWRFGLASSGDDGTMRQHVGTNGLVRWHHNREDLIPNVARGWDVSEDGTEFTFYLRKGMRWSDGAPLTTEDVAFAINDVLLNSDYGALSTRFKAGEDPMSLEVIDETTFKIVFPRANGEFLGQMAREEGAAIVFYAKHYCATFHPDYNDNLQPLIDASGASDWQTLFVQKCGDPTEGQRWLNPERPVLDPWVMENPLDGGATVVTLSANPYFWQVDAAGNQLPYIGALEGRIFQDPEAMTLAAIAGQFDFQARGIDAAANRPVLADNRDAGDYQLYEVVGVGGNYNWIQPNLNHKDQVIADLFNQKDFRIALSIGMDRQEVIDTALLGDGTPWQTGPWEGKKLYNERLATQHLDYDPEKANALLDGLGLDQRNDEGIRLMSDGRPARFLIDIRNTYPQIIDMIQVVQAQWAEIGIAIDLNVVDRSLHKLRSANADHDFTADSGNTTLSPGQLPSALLPIDDSSRHAPLWTEWYTTGGASGVEPPEHVKKRYEIWEAINSNVDPDRRVTLYQQLSDIAAEQFEAFGVTKNPSTYGVVKNGLMNVLPGMVSTSQWPSPANAFMPQAWYWKG